VRTRGLARFSVIQCEVEAVREVPPVKRLYKRAPEADVCAATTDVR